MIDDKWAKAFAEEWIESWNAHDLERIFSHYTDAFEMSSPFIVQRMKEPSGTLKGKEAIRPYWEIGLAQTPPLRFELSNVLVGANGITILYRNQVGILVSEVLFFNAESKATHGFAHYAEKMEL